MSTDIRVLDELSRKRKTQQQQYLSVLLDEKGSDVSELLDGLIVIATQATKPTPTGDVTEDYKTRLSATKLLLELRGDYTPSKANMSVNLWFSSLIYGNKDDWPKETELYSW